MARRKKTALTHDDIMQASVRVDPVLRRRSELLWEAVSYTHLTLPTSDLV